MPRYQKLVRDRIPEIIAAHGEQAVTRILSEPEYREALLTKLHEEAQEFAEARSLIELVDVYEVVLALAKASGVSAAQLEKARAVRAAERGGFEKRIFLVETCDCLGTG